MYGLEERFMEVLGDDLYGAYGDSGYGSSSDSGVGSAGVSDVDSFEIYDGGDPEFDAAWEACAEDYPDYGAEFGACMEGAFFYELAQESSDSGESSDSTESSALSLAQESDHTSGSGISVDSCDLECIDRELEELTLAQEDSAYGDEEDEFSIGTATEAELAKCDDAEDDSEWWECIDDVFGSDDDVTV